MKNYPENLPDKYSDVKVLLDSYHSVSEIDLLAEGAVATKRLFLDMAEHVPAYHKFLNDHDISVESPDAAEIAPAVDKDNYLRAYHRHELCWDGKFKEGNWVISSTSGSTGEPFYFPRTSLQDQMYAATAEAYLLENFEIDRKSTLYIVAFPMGAWIGGVFTYEAIRRVAMKGYHLSLITPGINKQEIIKAIKSLSHDFDQVIIGSYAPFLKDILDDGEKSGIDWKRVPVKFVFSAEAFSEEFRDYVQRKTGLQNIYLDTLNHYGTVDLGTMAHETSLSILVRRTCLKNPVLYEKLLGDATKLPTLAQYDPRLFYFEERQGNLFCSSNSGYPLYRYDLKDKGGVLTLDQVRKEFKIAGLDLDKEIGQAGLTDKIWNLPFVYVYERSDFSVSFFAFQIYPETLKKALLDPLLHDRLTGKFTMHVEYDDEGLQIFNVHIEMAGGVEAHESLRDEAREIIISQLLKENSEYRKTAEEYGVDRVAPVITLWPYEDSTYFRPGGKQKWIKK